MESFKGSVVLCMVPYRNSPKGCAPSKMGEKFISCCITDPCRMQFWGNCGIQPTLSSLTKDCPNPNKNPNPNVHKQDLNSSLAAVG